MKYVILCFFLSVSSGLQADWSLTDWAKNLFASKQSQAVQAYKSQDYEQGLAHCNDLINSDPYHPEHNYNVGNILYRQKKYQDAQQAFARTVQHVKASSKLVEQAAFNLGNSYYQLEQWQNAVDAYKQALKINEDNQQARHNLQLALQKLRELPENKQEQEDSENSQQQNQSGQNSDQNQKGCNDKSSQNQSGDSGSQNSQNQSGDNSGQGNDSGQDGSDGDSRGDKDGQQSSSKQNQSSKTGSKKNNKDGDGQQQSGDSSGSDSFDDNGQSEKKSNSLKNNNEQGERDGRDGGLDQGDDSDSFDMNEPDNKNAGDEQSSKNSLLNFGKDADDEGDASQQFNQTQGAKENIANNHEQGQAGYAQQGDEHGADDAAGDDNKQARAFAKKPELKNQLQDLFESKACQDERLTDYHKDVMKTLEDLEEKVQKHIIKNKVAAQGAGKYGKNSW